MDSSHEATKDEEETSIESNSESPTASQDTRQSSTNQSAVFIILGSVLFERIAFYSIAANLTLSLGETSPLQWQYQNILIAAFIFIGTSYFSSIIFAAISDAKLGRAKTIILGFPFYLIGYVLAILMTHPNTYEHLCIISGESSSVSFLHEPCATTILPTLLIIALGAGAVQANMAVIGAEQIRESNMKSRYFDKYILAVNVGAAFAKLNSSLIQNQTDHLKYYYVVYIIAITALTIAAVLFLCGWRYLRHVEPYDSVITNCIPVIINALRTRSQYNKNEQLVVNEDIYSAMSNSLHVIQDPSERKESIEATPESVTFLDFAKVRNGGKFHDRIVDDVKSLRSAIIVFGFFVPYFLIYSQINSSFSLQGKQMNTLNKPGVATFTSLTDSLTVIIGIVILNVFVYKRLDARNRQISIATKFLIGMIFACATMCLTGSIEIVRQEGCDNKNVSNTSSLPIYVQIPQYIGMGISEIFAMVASYEFAYYAATRSAQSLFMSLRFCLQGISSFIGAAYVYFFPTNYVQLNFLCQNNEQWQWSFYTYFYILAGLQLLFIIIFLVIQRRFRIVKPNLEN